MDSYLFSCDQNTILYLQLSTLLKYYFSLISILSTDFMYRALCIQSEKIGMFPIYDPSKVSTVLGALFSICEIDQNRNIHPVLVLN